MGQLDDRSAARHHAQPEQDIPSDMTIRTLRWGRATSSSEAVSAKASTEPHHGSASDHPAAQGQDEPRGWVVRLGHYLRIFGRLASGTLGYRTSEGWLDTLVEQAKEREDEFGGNRGK